mmetsp:Transcript_139074/g.443804  ORF Transcript_139074/g.443804 Transcript_139074/m.443804 type:complete len:231 (+) Transcript_139074:787-1479(+)
MSQHLVPITTSLAVRGADLAKQLFADASRPLPTEESGEDRTHQAGGEQHEHGACGGRGRDVDGACLPAWSQVPQEEGPISRLHKTEHQPRTDQVPSPARRQLAEAFGLVNCPGRLSLPLPPHQTRVPQHTSREQIHDHETQSLATANECAQLGVEVAPVGGPLDSRDGSDSRHVRPTDHLQPQPDAAGQARPLPGERLAEEGRGERHGRRSPPRVREPAEAGRASKGQGS